jgi:hypothetical protein
MLLNFHVNPATALQEFDARAPIFAETLDMLVQARLLNRDDDFHHTPGPALPCFIEAITSIQAPVMSWYCPTLPPLEDSRRG